VLLSLLLLSIRAKQEQARSVCYHACSFFSFFKDHLFPVDQSTRRTVVVVSGEYGDRMFSIDGVQSSGAVMLSCSETCVVITHMLQTIKPSVIMLSNCIMLMP
jgi:hypothetical protein